MDKLGGPRVTISDTEAVKCEKCGGEVFTQGFMMRRVSPILTGDGRPGIIPIPVFVCDKCGHVNSEFIPEEIRNNVTGNEE